MLSLRWFAPAACAASLTIFLLWWLVLYRALKPGAYEFEPAGRSFEPTLTRYFEIARVLISLAVGSVALLAGYVGYVLHAKPQSLAIIQRVVAWPLLLLAFSVIYAVLFLASLARSYERYQHFPDSYTRFWYSLNQALAFAALTCFASGYLVLALSVVSMVIEG